MPARRRLAGARGYALRAGVVHSPRAGAVSRSAGAVAHSAMVANYHRCCLSCLARLGRPRRRDTGLAGDLHLVSDVLHLLAAGAWLGGLPAFAFLLLRTLRSAGRGRDAQMVRVVDRFSLLGVVSVGILLASGLVNSWNLLSGPRDLIASDYGRLVALKIALFGAMVAIAAVNRVLPDAAPAASRPLCARSSATAWRKSVSGSACCLFVGVLGTMPPAAHVHAIFDRHPARCRFRAHPHGRGHGRRDHRARPRRARRCHDSRLARRFLELPGKGRALGARSPNHRRRERSNAPLSSKPDGSWLVNDLTLAPAGIWAARVIVRSVNGDPIVLDAPVVIER